MFQATLFIISWNSVKLFHVSVLLHISSCTCASCLLWTTDLLRLSCFFFLFIFFLQSSFTSLRKKSILQTWKKEENIRNPFSQPLFPLPLVSRRLFRHDYPCFWGWLWLALVFFGSLAQATAFLSRRERREVFGSQGIILTGRMLVFSFSDL